MGRDCTHSPDANSGILIVRHSQSAKNPECVFPNTLLWAGYSLSYNAYSHDLGSPSSCFKTLSMQAVSCDGIHQEDTNSVCSFVSNYNRTIWLPVTDDDIPNKINKKELGKYVSRCVVCEMPLNFIVVHSQTRNEAICPTNWAEIWRGYSFFTVSCFYCDAFGQKKECFFIDSCFTTVCFSSFQRTEASGIIFQNLQGTGSCLEKFQKNQFIECDATTDECHTSTSTNSFPLLAIDEDPKKFNVSDPASLEMLSKCKVCMRQSMSSYDEPTSTTTEQAPALGA